MYISPNSDQSDIIITLLYVCHSTISKIVQIEKIKEIKNKMMLSNLLPLFLNKRKRPNKRTIIVVGMWE